MLGTCTRYLGGGHSDRKRIRRPFHRSRSACRATGFCGDILVASSRIGRLVLSVRSCTRVLEGLMGHASVFVFVFVCMARFECSCRG